ncbi:MAG: polysaccharide deacetylase [Firmicutes bacterium]|nr:polysaccharide deacetylase [Bacillota bacterium]
MSVKTWKRVITLSVILIVVVLLATSLIFVTKNNRLSDTYEAVVADLESKETAAPDPNQYLDLSAYDDLDAAQADTMLRFMIDMQNQDTLPYHDLYPDLYVDNDFAFEPVEKKTCYLTFDDGPDTELTVKILDILKENNIKATFFVVYKKGDAEKELYKRIVNEGHTIGIHTASHNYSTIYASVEDYLKDFNRISKHIESITGVKPEIFRFPGGSINGYNSTFYVELISEMLRRGYVYYDWNCSSGDAAASNPSSSIIRDNVLKRAEFNKKIVLMHDSKGHSATVAALPEIIKGLTDQGYQFDALTNDVAPACFAYFKY